MVGKENMIRQKIGWFIKKYLKYIVLILCLLVTGILELVHGSYVSELSSQELVKRWNNGRGFAQISCFFPEGEGLSRDAIAGVERNLSQAMQEASIDTSGADGRTLVDAYSAEADLYVSNQKIGSDVRAFGVSKDYFLFHPMELLDGSYFQQEDEAQDGVILDENVAWKLFGSNHVAGMTVDIGSISYRIRGVVRADEGHYSEAAGEETPSIYVDFQILERMMSGDDSNVSGGDSDTAAVRTASSYTADCYEILIQNPVSDFGTTALSKILEDSGVTGYEMVENSTRFGLAARWTRLRNFGARSMNAKGIIYPYWENRARAYEDVSTLLLVVELLLLCYPAFMLARGIYLLWKKRKEIGTFCRKKVTWFFGDFLVPKIKKLYKDVYISRKSSKNKVE